MPNRKAGILNTRSCFNKMVNMAVGLPIMGFGYGRTRYWWVLWQPPINSPMLVCILMTLVLPKVIMHVVWTVEKLGVCRMLILYVKRHGGMITIFLRTELIHQPN